MRRSRCLLLDANIVIGLFQLGLWEAVVDRCELVLSEVVVDEADFYVDDHGNEHRIDLQPYIHSGQIDVRGVTASDLATFRARFDDLYIQKLDDGETESLAIGERDDDYQICSADAIVFRVLAVLDRGQQGISLEELLEQVGLGRSLDRKFGKSFRLQNHDKGLRDRMAGIGLRR